MRGESGRGGGVGVEEGRESGRVGGRGGRGAGRGPLGINTIIYSVKYNAQTGLAL